MALRDILVVTIVLILAVISLRRPWVGIMNWTWLSIMNPHRYCWGFASSAPVAAIAGATTLLGLLFTKDRRSPFHGAPVWWFLIFTIWITLSWLFGYDPAGDYAQWNKVVKIYLMIFVALALLQTKLQIIAYTWVTIGSIALLAAKGGLFTVMTGGGYKVFGPPGSFIGDNNSFALAVIICVPVLHFLKSQVNQSWIRHTITIVMILCVASGLGSQSRGALLALITMGAVFWWRSPRKLPVTILLIVTTLILVPMMPDTWWERMDTIQTYEEDKSAMGRIYGWMVAVEVAKERFFGGGMSYQHEELFRKYSDYSFGVIAAHSIYFQTLGNHGFIGLFLYLTFWTSTYLSAGRLRKRVQDIPEAKWAAELAAMIQVSLVSFAIGGAFLSLQYFDLPYNLMAIVVLASRWVRERGWETDPRESFLEAIGFQNGNSISKAPSSGYRSAKPR
ncbi:putative O-glycosylation ligase, exosortase A system-associated [Thiocystis violacea]|uniref:putative O-glycosylation ligase, exosortase A system-associated n=1 Tax=Thiocystis violacea TaxID=13725 RepID=UPI001907BEBA|nr:putative O-glycosylation ligase, exosortase A system-associated [Thiocystis violacea]MBK1724691.1 putative O-glycosylation ligase, exosortase A system-associated [Thiocystis violacea]